MSLKEILENMRLAADDVAGDTMKDGSATGLLKARVQTALNPFAEDEGEAFESEGAAKGAMALEDAVGGPKTAAAIQFAPQAIAAAIPANEMIGAGVKGAKNAWSGLKGMMGAERAVKAAAPAAKAIPGILEAMPGAKKATAGTRGYGEVLVPYKNNPALPKPKAGLIQEARAGIESLPNRAAFEMRSVGAKELDDVLGAATKAADTKAIAERAAMQPDQARQFKQLRKFIDGTGLNAAEKAGIKGNVDMADAVESAMRGDAEDLKALKALRAPKAKGTGVGGVVIKPNSGKW